MKNRKKIIAGILVLFIFGVLIYGCYYFFNNYDDTTNIVKTEIEYVTSSADRIDKLEQPTPNVKVDLDTLPENDSTILEIDFNNFKKLFRTTKRSILFLDKTGCAACESFKPLLESALDDYNLNAYSIDITKFSEDEIRNTFDYIFFDGTPVTYIIENGKVTHTFNGSTSKEVIKAFLDIYYLR